MQPALIIPYPLICLDEVWVPTVLSPLQLLQRSKQSCALIVQVFARPSQEPSILWSAHTSIWHFICLSTWLFFFYCLLHLEHKLHKSRDLVLFQEVSPGCRTIEPQRMLKSRRWQQWAGRCVAKSWGPTQLCTERASLWITGLGLSVVERQLWLCKTIQQLTDTVHYVKLSTCDTTWEGTRGSLFHALVLMTTRKSPSRQFTLTAPIM